MNRFSAVTRLFIPAFPRYLKVTIHHPLHHLQYPELASFQGRINAGITPTGTHNMRSVLFLGHPLPTPASSDSSVAPAVHSVWYSPLELHKERSQFRVRCPETSFPSGVDHACHVGFPSHHVDQWLNMRGNGVIVLRPYHRVEVSSSKLK